MNIQTQLTPDVVGLTKVAPFSRRGFMTASAAITAGYTLAAGPVRADVIKTDTDGLETGDVKIKVADGEMPGYFARPKGVANPPVVLVAMEIFGLHEYIKDVVRRLAKLGALAVAPDYYFRKDNYRPVKVVISGTDTLSGSDSGSASGAGTMTMNGEMDFTSFNTGISISLPPPSEVKSLTM